MSYIGVPPQATFSSGLLDRFTSTTGTTVTLTHDIASENDIVVFVNFVKQDSTTYSVGGTGNKTLTLGGTLVSSDIVEVHYLNIVGQTNAPSAGSVTTATINDLAVTGAKLNTDVISAQTALTSAPADTDELLISDAGVLKRIDVSLVGGDNTPAWQVYAAASPTGLAFNAYNTMQLDTVGFDTDSGFNTSTYKYTVPEAGKYQMNFQYGVESVSGGNIITVLAEIYNETTGKILIRRRTISGGDHSSTNQPLVNTISGVKTLAANDVIYCRVYVYSSSGSLKLNGNSDQEWSQFSGFKLKGV